MCINLVAIKTTVINLVRLVKCKFLFTHFQLRTRLGDKIQDLDDKYILRFLIGNLEHISHLQVV